MVRGGREVLHGISFDVPRGQVLGLLGPSGSGKTTLLRAIVGVQVVASGSVDVLGAPAGDRSVRGRVGYATQSPAVYGDLSVRENLAYFADVLGLPRGAVAEVIERVDLAAHADRVVGALSGGQRGRVNLAAALLGGPELIVLDEPTVGLDPVLRERLWALFHELAAEGAALVVSSHVMEEAGRCDRLVLLREGVVLADATPAELRAGTGTDDLDQAFLRLVRQEAQA